MSRSGYSDDFDVSQWESICYRGAVASAFRGKRGQSFLKDLLAALEAMPEKRLVSGELQTEQGEVCALGAIAKVRNIEMPPVYDDDDSSTLIMAERLNIANAMAREIVYMNDETYAETPEQRYEKVLNWIRSEIKS